jgi:biofilm PGA synthesis N-glycosyltransferase PgaC
VVRQGYRVIFDGRARAWDLPSLGSEREFWRKVRTLTGNYQLLRISPWLVRRENPCLFEFISHKLIRLTVPFALVAVFIVSCLLPGWIYRIAFWLQVAGYTLSLLGWAGWKLGPLSRLADAACTLVTLNVAAVVAFANFVTGHNARWTPVSIGKEMRA